MDALVFQESPIIELATNKFVNVPVILQYDKTPLISIVHEIKAGYEIEIPIFYKDGTYLAKVKGSRLFATKEGEKAGVTLRHPDKMTVCEINGKTVFEIKRDEAAALETHAELYTNDGAFLKCSNKDLAGYVLKNEQQLKIGSIIMVNNTFSNCKIGIHIKSDGSIGICCGKG